MRRAIARLSTWWARLLLAAIVLTAVLELSGLQYLAVVLPFLLLAFVRPPWDRERAPVEIDPPLRGRWAALNSPATKVPSHGIRAYGQTYAVDLLHPRPPGTAPGVGWAPRLRRARDFPSFGEPVLAVHSGVVVAVGDRQRDHRSRQSWPELVYLLVLEGLVRELGGARYVLGNHVVVDHGDGVHAGYAHLRRDSVRVRVGDRVDAGDQLAEVGNSGNSSEPHLHLQLMDDAVPTAAAGVPFRFRGIEQDPSATDPSLTTKPVSLDIEPGVPANGQVFVAR